MKISDKTKLLLAISMLYGLKRDIEHRLYKCEDCKFTLDYIDYCLKILEESEENEQEIIEEEEEEEEQESSSRININKEIEKNEKERQKQIQKNSKSK